MAVVPRRRFGRRDRDFRQDELVLYAGRGRRRIPAPRRREFEGDDRAGDVRVRGNARSYVGYHEQRGYESDGWNAHRYIRRAEYRHGDVPVVPNRLDRYGDGDSRRDGLRVHAGRGGRRMLSEGRRDGYGRVHGRRVQTHGESSSGRVYRNAFARKPDV